jgi:nicotinamide mononucleotide adenylyltransferase
VSSFKPSKIEEALNDVDWVNSMHEELNNFTRNEVWELVERSKNHNVIRTKWVFRNKQDQDGIVIKKQSKIGNTRVYTI